MTRVALFLTRLSERWVPSAFVIACLLTFLTMGAAVGFTESSLPAVLVHWGDGLWILLKFGMQMCLIIVTGSIIADSPPMRRGLDALARAVKSDRGAVVCTAAVSMILCWVHWGLGLIASAFLARAVARRRPNVDFRLLVASAYLGMTAVWHAGLSGSAPLLVATPEHFLADTIGVIPTSETIFTTFNLLLTLTTFLALSFMVFFLYPRRSADAFRLGPEALARLKEPPVPAGRKPAGAWLRFWEHSYAIPLSLGLIGAGYLAADVEANGFRLTLDKLNCVFLLFSVLLHPSPAAFVRAAEKAAGYAHGIIIQFPLYAGMFGVIRGSGLDQLIAAGFVSAATAKTLPLFIYWYSGILNYFVPSGGSQWAISAPYLLAASKSLGVSYSHCILAFAWGDMLTNAIQPFWCIPLLAIAGLEFKDVLGYLLMVFFVCLGIGSVAFLLI